MTRFLACRSLIVFRQFQRLCPQCLFFSPVSHAHSGLVCLTVVSRTYSTLAHASAHIILPERQFCPTGAVPFSLARSKCPGAPAGALRRRNLGKRLEQMCAVMGRMVVKRSVPGLGVPQWRVRVAALG